LTTGSIVDQNGKDYSDVGKGISPNMKVTTNQLADYINAVRNKLSSIE
jgi:hypothetical protein